MGISRRLDTSSTTQMAELLVKHWRSCGTTWTKFVWSPLSWIVMGKTLRRSSIGTLMGGSTELGMSVRSSKTMVMSVSTCGWHQNGWKEYGSHVEEDDEKCGYWRTHIISWPWKLGMYSAWMQTDWNNHWTKWEDVWITYFCWSNIEIIAKREKPHAQTAAWSHDMEGHAQKYVERHCDLANKKSGATVQSFKSLFGSSSIQAGGTRITWRIVRSLLTFFLTCLDLARIGRPDILWSVNKLARSVTKCALACDRRLACVFLEVEHLFQSTGWARNCYFAQFYRVWIHFSGCRLTYGLLALDLWDIVIEVLRSTNNTGQPKHTNIQETDATLHSKAKTQKVQRVMWTMCPPTHTFFSQWISVVHFLRQRWDTCLESTELLLTGCSTESIWKLSNKSNMWTPKTNSLTFWPKEVSSKSNMWTPKTNSLTFWPKEVSQEMSGILVAISATLFPTILIRLESRAPCQKEVRRRHRMKALQRRKRSHVWCCVSASKGVRNSLHSGQSRDADERKVVVRATRQLVLPDSNSEIGHPQASRQEN